MGITSMIADHAAAMGWKLDRLLIDIEEYAELLELSDADAVEFQADVLRQFAYRV